MGSVNKTTNLYVVCARTLALVVCLAPECEGDFGYASTIGNFACCLATEGDCVCGCKVSGAFEDVMSSSAPGGLSGV